MTALALMLQGTGSDVGKSLLVAGLARAFNRRGLRVRPFKPQNMSNNAAVATDGGEIGRAQALQARAAGVAPSVHMNPVLLKPQSDVGAQVVVQGKVAGTTNARDYQASRSTLLDAVLDSFERLVAEADLVLVEGAGSASEVNLRDADIANMGFARAADVPVVLVGDIERGGVIASLVGTKVVLDPADAAMIEGFIVNRFRGDPTLFADGMRTIVHQTGWQALGLVPFFADAQKLPAEDVLGLPGRIGESKAIRIAVLAYPRIANFDDFDPLRQEPGVEVTFVRRGEVIPADCSLVILPGSKATISDLAALREAGWDIDLKAHLRRGGHVLGICGGFQMLGQHIADPDGIEGPPGEVEGLGLLDVTTVLEGDKVLVEVTGRTLREGIPFKGYEMHVGRTTSTAQPLLAVDRRHGGSSSDSAIDATGRIAGCYIHGLMTDDRQRRHWLDKLGAIGSALDYEREIDATLDGLAGHLEKHIDLSRLLALARQPRIKPVR